MVEEQVTSKETRFLTCSLSQIMAVHTTKKTQIFTDRRRYSILQQIINLFVFAQPVPSQKNFRNSPSYCASLRN